MHHEGGMSMPSLEQGSFSGEEQNLADPYNNMHIEAFEGKTPPMEPLATSSPVESTSLPQVVENPVSTPIDFEVQRAPVPELE
mmetsp:Transcript_43089/g.58486  ORF Transcript_43089/g.58486 Transcript_43089/m.58486 type:complete len:83 (-) Transcript_43089:339-587(-)